MFRTIVLLILFCPIKVLANAGQRSCLPEKTAAQLLWNVSSNAQAEIIQPLSSKVQLIGRQAGLEVNFRLRFDPAFSGVSLPYNLYAVLIVQNGSVVGWWDYTHGCQGPGISFFPGREIALPTVKLVGAEADQLQIMVWGKL